jgi:hypothetical protein
MAKVDDLLQRRAEEIVLTVIARLADHSSSEGQSINGFRILHGRRVSLPKVS